VAIELINSIIHELLFFAILCIGWWLYIDLYPKVRVDFTRQKLFKLRDDLFDLAVDGKLSFDSNAYGMCRKTLNGVIRYCHRLSIYRIIIDLTVLGDERDRLKDDYCTAKDKAMSELSDEQKKLIDQIYSQMHYIVRMHLIHGCLPLMVFGAILRRFFMFFKMFTGIKEYILNAIAPGMIVMDAKFKKYGSGNLSQI
jgi:hypothetical protein